MFRASSDAPDNHVLPPPTAPCTVGAICRAALAPGAPPTLGAPGEEEEAELDAVIAAPSARGSPTGPPMGGDSHRSVEPLW